MTAAEFYAQFKDALRTVDEWPGNRAQVFVCGSRVVLVCDGVAATFEAPTVHAPDLAAKLFERGS